MYAPLRVAIVGGAFTWSISSRKEKRYARFLAHHRKAMALLTTEPRSAFIFLNPNKSVE